MTPHKAYCDGGTIGPNPSLLGGTWCWVWIDNTGTKIKHEKGIIEPEDIELPEVTNNVAELYAAIRLIDSLPEEWEGTIYTDSLITLRRITTGNKFKGVPIWLTNWTMKLRSYKKYQVSLLSGHPTKAELVKGFGKRGYPVSEHNKFCDQQCSKLASDFKLSLEKS